MKTLLEEINDLTWWNEINKLKNILKKLISSFISDAPINGNPFVRQDGEWVEQTAGSGIESITGDFVDNSDPLNPIIEDPRTYKVYTAIISQSGTSNPTASILENTIGSVVPTRNAIGEYYFSSTAFNGFSDADKIYVSISNGGVRGIFLAQYIPPQSLVRINTFNLSEAATDALLNNANIEIRVYS